MQEMKEVVVKKCLYHTAHQQKLHDHEKDIANNKIDHKNMWDGIKDKVPNKLFYIFVAIVIGGLGVVYNGIHNVDKNLAIISTKVDDQKEDIRDLKVQLDTHNDNKRDYDHGYNPKP